MGAAQPFSARPATAMVLARIRHAQGRLGEARLRLEEALGWAESHAPEWLPAGRRELARISLDEGKVDEAARLAALAARGEEATAPLDRAETALVLADALLARSDEQGARAALHRALLLAGITRTRPDAGTPAYPGNVDARLRVETAAARLGARLDPGGPTDAFDRLHAVEMRAIRLGFVGEAHEALLARCELLLGRDPLVAGVLRALRVNAHRDGHGNIVRRISRLLDPDGAEEFSDAVEAGDGGAVEGGQPVIPDAAPGR